MYTILKLSEDDARYLVAEMQPRRQHCGPNMRLSEPWDGSQQAIPGSSATVKYDRLNDQYLMSIHGYVTVLPALLAELNIEPELVTYVRVNCAPTRAKAGRYVNMAGTTAIIEANVIDDRQRGSAQAVHQLTVSGPTLNNTRAYLDFVSSGLAGSDLVDHFE